MINNASFDVLFSPLLIAFRVIVIYFNDAINLAEAQSIENGKPLNQFLIIYLFRIFAFVTFFPKTNLLRDRDLSNIIRQSQFFPDKELKFAP